MRPWNEHTCEKCDAWRPVYPANDRLGNCVRLPIIKAAPKTIALTPCHDWRDEPDPLRDIEILRTTADFGCVSFTPRPK